MVNFLLSIRSIFTFYIVNSTFNFLYGQVDLLYGQFFSIYICQCRMQTADFKGGGGRRGVKNRLRVKCRLKTADQG